MGRKPKEVQKPVYLDNLTAIIRKDGKKTVRIESWMYNSILDALRWIDPNLDHIQAHDAAKKCCRTHQEITFSVGKNGVTVELKNEGG